MVFLGAVSVAGAEGLDPLLQAVAASKPIVDFRLRYENVEQEGIVNQANAATWRLRIGAETGKAWNTSLLAEAELVEAPNDSYRADNAVTNLHTTYPVVADPASHEINRLQLTNTSLPATTVILGRQRINLDDQRFVGSVGWRQNEQTFDALRLVNQGVEHLSIDVTAFNRVNRIYGADSPQSPYQGRGYLGNVAYQLPYAKLTGFAYLLDFDPMSFVTGPGVTSAQAAALNPARASTSTYGLRASGEIPLGAVKLGYVTSYATQKPRADNPVQFDHNVYFMGELAATYQWITLTAGEESLHGDGTIGFSTPLATLHKFQGWVDKFLSTPANGIDDRYLSLGATRAKLGPFATVTATLVGHDYQAQHVDADYGQELDMLLAAKYRRTTTTLKYGRYFAAATTPTSVARDTDKFWAQFEFAL
ncbi:MAG: hypothetical protein QM718_00090 [Steroidobacteraceae bacterium]